MRSTVNPKGDKQPEPKPGAKRPFFREGGFKGGNPFLKKFLTIKLSIDHNRSMDIIVLRYTCVT